MSTTPTHAAADEIKPMPRKLTDDERKAIRVYAFSISQDVTQKLIARATKYLESLSEPIQESEFLYMALNWEPTIMVARKEGLHFDTGRAFAMPQEILDMMEEFFKPKEQPK